MDDADTVYVADAGNNRVVKMDAGATTPVALPFTGLNFPNSVAVDQSKNVYVTDLNNNRVLKLAAGSNAVSSLPFTNLVAPFELAVSGRGDVYVIDFHNRVLKLAAGYQPIALGN
ncbi:hypothetical protein [Mycobacterium stomatepiae]|uniref:hypothetical protein n=1 Tax=Mycobacterium stomatepiae TaxID=470076 RepID=UPI0015D427D4|nr:hypothetical protein [Mycobacterium stomatepiae]MCV7164831.1 hypothetical protein [Mycobacterium stomatepiae]